MVPTPCRSGPPSVVSAGKVESETDKLAGHNGVPMVQFMDTSDDSGMDNPAFINDTFDNSDQITKFSAGTFPI